jgi:fatty-acyl-CoA synthase
METPTSAPAGTPLSPLSFLMRSAVVFRDRLAVIDGETRLTYGDWLPRVRRMAGVLRDLGVRPGDRVAVLAPNSAMLLDAHYGVAMAGGVLVALNTRLTATEHRAILDHAGAEVLLFDDGLAELAGQLEVATSLSSSDYEEALATAAAYHHELGDELDLIALNYTSGTTGLPKGVMYAHRGTFLQAMAMAYHARLDPTTVHLWTLPMFHCNGWAFTWAVTAAGGTHVCLRKVDAAEIWRLVREEGVTSLNAAPTVLLDLAASPDAAAVATPLAVGTGGAPPSPVLLERLGRLNLTVTHLYGLTETIGPSVICEVPPELTDAPVEVLARHQSRQGNANIVGVPVRVVDESDQDVAADGEAMGEIVLRGNTVSLGYYRDPETTAEQFRGGWFHTGDLGVMHADGYVELRDRAKDIIISGGENISSVEVEQVLARHPDIQECAVVAGPHERWGEVPVAFVTLAPQARLTEEEVVAFAREHLPGFKVPKQIVFGALPKTATGKVQKFELRQGLRDRT